MPWMQQITLPANKQFQHTNPYSNYSLCLRRLHENITRANTLHSISIKRLYRLQQNLKRALNVNSYQIHQHCSVKKYEICVIVQNFILLKMNAWVWYLGIMIQKTFLERSQAARAVPVYVKWRRPTGQNRPISFLRFVCFHAGSAEKSSLVIPKASWKSVSERCRSR